MSNFDQIINKIRAKHRVHERNYHDFNLIRVFTKHKYATVYVASDTKTGSTVFLKELTSKIDLRRLLMFYRELKAFSVTNCEFINTLVGFTLDDKFSIILKYHENDTFSNF